MGLIEDIAEERIREAYARGQFANLPGKGKPYRLDGYLYEDPEKRVFNKLLRDNHFLPITLELRKCVEEQQEKIQQFLVRMEHIYSQAFANLLQVLGVDPGYPATNYRSHLKAHHNFLKNDLPIWFRLKKNSRTMLAIRQFKNMQTHFLNHFLKMVQQLNQLIDEHNQEVLKQCIKERDHFRITTTLGKIRLGEYRQYFLWNFPGLTGDWWRDGR